MSKAYKKTALVFTAHPDDHLCCSGTMMLLKDRGYRVEEVLATSGELGAWWDEEGNKKQGFDQGDLVKVRRDEFKKASEIIGSDGTHCLSLPDGSVGKTEEALKELIRLIRTERPKFCFIHHIDDYHPDHIAYSKLVQEAAHKAAWSIYPELGNSFRIPALLMFDGMYVTSPHMLVNVTQYKDLIDQIQDVYASQIYPSERRLLESMTEYHGFHARQSTANVELAEAFTIPDRFPVIGSLSVFEH